MVSHNVYPSHNAFKALCVSLVLPALVGCGPRLGSVGFSEREEKAASPTAKQQGDAKANPQSSPQPTSQTGTTPPAEGKAPPELSAEPLTQAQDLLHLAHRQVLSSCQGLRSCTTQLLAARDHLQPTAEPQSPVSTESGWACVWLHTPDAKLESLQQSGLQVLTPYALVWSSTVSTAQECVNITNSSAALRAHQSLGQIQLSMLRGARVSPR